MNARPWWGRRLILTLRLGEMPEHVPTLRECWRGTASASERLDGGVIDRLLKRRGVHLRAGRLHSAARGVARHSAISLLRRYDAIEQATGIARQVRIELANPCDLRELADALRQCGIVESATPDYLVSTPADGLDPRLGAMPDEAAMDWPRAQLRLDAALGYEPGDPAVVLGLADTGVALQHADLQARLRRGFDSVDIDPITLGERYVLTGDNARRDNDPDDDVGHGSGCAGILVADSEPLRPGAAGRAGLIPARVLGAARTPNGKVVGIGAIANIDLGMKRLVDLGAKVINMSFGTPASALAPDDPHPHREVVAYALARGCVLIAASGNSGKEERYYPAALDGVIAVGATDRDGNVASFTTRGAHVAVCAPGRGIWTCGVRGYQQASGTSFAAPFVAGIAALVVARGERRAFPVDGALVRQVLVSGARAHPSTAPPGCGVGVVDALASLQHLDAAIDATESEPDASE